MCGMSVRIDNLRAHHSGSGSAVMSRLIPDACFTHLDFSNKSVSDLINVGTVGDDDIDIQWLCHTLQSVQ